MKAKIKLKGLEIDKIHQVRLLTLFLLLWCSLLTKEVIAQVDEKIIGVNYFEGISKIATSPLKGLIVSAEHSGRITLWNSKTGEKIRQFLDPEKVEQFESPNALRFISFQDRIIVLSSVYRPTQNPPLFQIIRIWDTQALEPIQSHNIPFFSYTNFSGQDVGISPGGRSISIRVGGKANVCWGEEFKDTAWFPVDEYGQDLAVLAPDGEKILIISNKGNAELIDFKTRKKIQDYSFPFQTQAANFSTDGNLVAIGTYVGGVDIWDVKSGEKVISIAREKPLPLPRKLYHEPKDRIFELSFSPNNKLLAVRYNTKVIVWKINSGKKLITWDGLKELKLGSSMYDSGRLGFIGEEDTLVIAGLKSIIMLDLKTRK